MPWPLKDNGQGTCPAEGLAWGAEAGLPGTLAQGRAGDEEVHRTGVGGRGGRWLPCWDPRGHSSSPTMGTWNPDSAVLHGSHYSSWSLGSQWANPAPRPRACHKHRPLGGGSEPQTGLPARYPPPNPEGGPAGSAHSSQAPGVRLCLVLQRSPCLWRL